MAQLTAGPSTGFDMNALSIGDIADADVISSSSSKLVLDLGDGYTDTFTTTGARYDSNGHPTAGTIQGISETLHGGGTFALTGVNISATSFFGYVQGNDNAGALNALFAGDDTLTGSSHDDRMSGFGGNNVLTGGEGADTLTGGAGNDHLYGQSSSGGSDGNDVLAGGDGADYLQGNAGDDQLNGQGGSDRIQGGQGNDTVSGDAGNDTVNGNLGDDRIDGGDGNDLLRGGQGNDSVAGGAGDDVLSGDKGADTLTGGAGADIFRFAAGDAAYTISGPVETIADFAHGTDHIGVGFAISAFLVGASQASLGDAAATAQALLSGHGGDHEVAAVQVGSDTYLFWGDNGSDTVADAVKLSGVGSGSLSASDLF